MTVFELFFQAKGRKEVKLSAEGIKLGAKKEVSYY